MPPISPDLALPLAVSSMYLCLAVLFDLALCRAAARRTEEERAAEPRRWGGWS